MKVENYFKSLAQELEALQRRVRYLIANRHWQTDGEWKESVLRQVLRRHLPDQAVVGRGFVVDRDSSTHQVDILIHDSTKPVLFRDGDLVFVTPDAVLGLIEVKSRVDPNTFGKAAQKMAADVALVRIRANTKAFAAIFAFEAESAEPAIYLQQTADAAKTWNNRLDFTAIGINRFQKYWNEDPKNPNALYAKWHSYELPNLAPGYFIHNVVDAVSPESVWRNNDVWFPPAGKEPYRDAVISSAWSDQHSHQS